MYAKTKLLLALPFLALLIVGPLGELPSGCVRADEPESKNGDKEKEDAKPPKTLLQWQFGKEPEDDGEEEVDTIPTDRPDFTENSRNVGLGRIQLECGYTFIQDRGNGTLLRRHSYPEALLRVGMFAEWFELRLGQNFGSEGQGQGAFPGIFNGGAEDLYIGVGLGLTEQRGIFPESRINLQARVPTGADSFTAEEFLPGFNYLYGWDVIKDKVTFAGSSQVNRVRDDSGHYYVEWAQALTTGITITEKLGLYLECFGLFPAGSIDPGTGPEYYFDGGFTYKITPNFQIDIRAGVGLNRHADDFFTGSGFGVRF